MSSDPADRPPSLTMVYIAMGLFVLIAAAAAWTLASNHIALFPTPKEAPPVYYPLPEFSVTNQDGKTITNETMKGKVWAADFIFTVCPGPCLELTKRFAEVQKALPPDGSMRLMSFSVDPKRDQPPVLAAYGARHGVDPARWDLVTAPKEKMYPLILQGFRLALQDNSAQADVPLESQFVHSTRVALIDQIGQIRGYYDGLSDQGMHDLKRDMQQLLMSPPKAATK